MNRALFQIGVYLVLFSLVVWLDHRLNHVVNVTDREAMAFVGLAGLLMLPELLHQLHQFFTSGSRSDD
jgi:hypothetical protein